MAKLPRQHKTIHGRSVIIQPFEETERGWVSLADWKGRTNQKWFNKTSEIPDAVQELIDRKAAAERLSPI